MIRVALPIAITIQVAIAIPRAIRRIKTIEFADAELVDLEDTELIMQI